MRRRVLWIAAAAGAVALAAGAGRRGEPLESGRPATVVLGHGQGDGAAGRSSAAFDFVAGEAGTLHVWAAAHDLGLEIDPRLVVAGADGGEIARDDDSGGVYAAYLALPVAAGDRLAITAELAEESPGGEVTVQATLVPRLPAEHEAAVAKAHRQIENGQQKRESGEYETALSILERAVDSLLEIPEAGRYGEVIAALELAAGEMRKARDHDLAIGGAERVHDFYARVLPEDHPLLEAARVSLGVSRKKLGDHRAAIELLDRVYATRVRTWGEDHAAVQAARQNLATMKSIIGDVEGALRLEQEMLDFAERAWADDDPDLQQARANSALTKKTLGDLRGALELEEKVHEVFARKLPDDHADLHRARVNLAVTRAEFGDLEGARAVGEAALAALERTRAADHPEVLALRFQLGVVRRRLGDSAGAQELLEGVLAARELSLPEEHEDRLAAARELAIARIAAGRLKDARTLLEAGMKVLRKTGGEEDLSIQRARLELAWVMRELGDLRGAQELEQRVLRIATRAFPDLGTDAAAAAVLNLWTAALSGSERPGRPLDLLAKSTAQALQVATASSDAPALAVRAEAARDALDTLLSLAGGAATDALVWAAADRARAAALAGRTGRREIARLPASEELSEMDARASRATSNVARAIKRGASALLAAQRDQERCLVRRTEHLAQLPQLAAWLGELAPGDVAARLEDDEAAVEFVRYARFEPDSAAKRVVARGDAYAAWVLRRDGEFRRIDLGEAAEIDAAINHWRATLTARAGDAARADETAAGAALRALVLDPLLDAIGPARRLEVVPAGTLAAVPLDALPFEDGRLGDRIPVRVRGSLRELCAAVAASPPAGEPTLLLVDAGDVALDRSTDGTDGEPAAATSRRRGAPVGILRSLEWERELAARFGSGEECAAVAGVFGEMQGAGAPTTTLRASAASRDAVLRAAPAARFVHFAGHVWHAPAAAPSLDARRRPEPAPGFTALFDRAAWSAGFPPLALAGIALAGANGPLNRHGYAESLVTCEEIAALDLSGCELVVVSAASDAPDLARAARAVASLQQAFAAAGARAAIVPLWTADPDATRELFSAFYRALWSEGLAPAAALRAAQRHLRSLAGPDGSPRFGAGDWAGWAASGAAG